MTQTIVCEDAWMTQKIVCEGHFHSSSIYHHLIFWKCWFSTALPFTIISFSVCENKGMSQWGPKPRKIKVSPRFIMPWTRSIFSKNQGFGQLWPPPVIICCEHLQANVRDGTWMIQTIASEGKWMTQKMVWQGKWVSQKRYVRVNWWLRQDICCAWREF